MTLSSLPRRRASSVPLVVLIALALVWASAVGAAAAAGWGAEQVIVPIDQSLAPLKIALGPDGVAHALAWSPADARLYTTIRRPGGTWQAPQALSDGQGYTSGLEFAFDSGGRAYTVFSEYNGSNYVVKFASRPPGGGWSNPIQLSESGQHAVGAVLVIDAARNLTAAWSRSNGTHNIVQTARRPAGGSWSAPQGISEVGGTAEAPRLAVDNDGRVTAVWHRYDGAHYRVQAAHRGVSGGWGTPTTLSAAGQHATSPAVDTDGNDAVYAVWTRSNGTNTIVQAARKPFGGFWSLEAPALSAAGQSAGSPLLQVDSQGNATTLWARSDGAHGIAQSAQRTASGGWQAAVNLSAAGGSASYLQLDMNRAGTALAAWARYDGAKFQPQAMRHPRGGVWQGPDTIPTTSSAIMSGANFDARGNALIGWYALGGAGYTGAIAPYDGAGPVSRMTRPTAPFSLSAPNVGWAATDVWSDVETYRVRRQSAPPNAGFGALNTWVASTTSTSRTMSGGSLGSTYCFSARATDSRNLVGAYSAERCTALPLNDGALNASPAWQRRSVAAAYRGDLLVAAQQGAVATSDTVKAKRIALVATRAPDAGSVDVFFAGDLVKTISLKPTASQNANSTYRKQIIPVAEFGSRRSGVVRIVTKSDKPVGIEGLGISAK